MDRSIGVNRFLLTVVFLLPSSSVIWASEIDFKGVAFGASEKVFTEKHPTYRCADHLARFKPVGDRYCLARGKPKDDGGDALHQAGTYAGIPANINASFYDDKLASVFISFHARRFNDVLQSI